MAEVLMRLALAEKVVKFTELVQQLLWRDRNMKPVQLIMITCLNIAPIAANAAISKFECKYSAYYTLDEVGLQIAEDFSLKFSIDTISGDAFMEGNNGLPPVSVHVGYEGLTFTEALATGAIQTTTIQNDGATVHSRHSMIYGELVPTQYYGECKLMAG